MCTSTHKYIYIYMHPIEFTYIYNIICCYMIGYSYIFMYPFLNTTMSHIPHCTRTEGVPEFAWTSCARVGVFPRELEKQPAGQVVICNWGNVY